MAPVVSGWCERRAVSERASRGDPRTDDWKRDGPRCDRVGFDAGLVSWRASSIPTVGVGPDQICSIPSGRRRSLRPADGNFGVDVGLGRRRMWQPTVRSGARPHPASTRPTGTRAGTHRAPNAGFVICQSRVGSTGRIPLPTPGTGINRVVSAGISPIARARATSASGDSSRASRSRDAWYRFCSTAVACSTRSTRICACAMNACTMTPLNAATTMPTAQSRTNHRRR